MVKQYVEVFLNQEMHAETPEAEHRSLGQEILYWIWACEQRIEALALVLIKSQSQRMNRPIIVEGLNNVDDEVE